MDRKPQMQTAIMNRVVTLSILLPFFLFSCFTFLSSSKQKLGGESYSRWWAV